MKLYWCVRVGRRRCVFMHLSSAIEDWRSHDGWAWLYPRLMTYEKFLSLGEFNGW